MRLTLALLLLAGCGSRERWRPEYFPLPSDRASVFGHVRLVGGGLVVFQSWSTDDATRSLDGVGVWQDAAGRTLHRGRLHVPLRYVASKVEVRGYTPDDHHLENGLVIIGGIALLAADIALGEPSTCCCE